MPPLNPVAVPIDTFARSVANSLQLTPAQTGTVGMVKPGTAMTVAADGEINPKFGTTTGTVADGGALATTTETAASAQVTAGQAVTAAGAAQTAATAAQTTASGAASAASTAQSTANGAASAASAAQTTATAAISGVQTTASATVTSGQSIVVPNGCNVFILNGTGTLASLTVTMPASPQAKQTLEIISNISIVLFTLLPNAGQTISSAPANVPVAIGGAISYQLSGTAWV
jgi:hypothetical protein